MQRALVFTPGDNEWTDCHRTNNGAWLPTERLAFVRRSFFPNPGFSLGQQPMRVEPRSRDPAFAEFVEHTLFVRGNIVFAGLRVVGSANNLAPWTGYDAGDSAAAPRPDRIAEFETRRARRRAAVLAWADRAFDEATARGAAGVVLFWQANPGIELLHGDFHELLVDQPLVRDAEPAPKVPKFQRVQGSGSPPLP